MRAGKLGEVTLARSIVYGGRGSIGGPGTYDVPPEVDYNLFAGPSPMFLFQAEDGIRDGTLTGVQTCALPICLSRGLGIFTKRMLSLAIAGISATSCARNSMFRRVRFTMELPADSFFRHHPLRVRIPCCKIGRASCRERGECSVVVGGLSG